MPESHSSFEECPLQRVGGHKCKKKSKNFKGPFRLIRLCVFGIILPSILIVLPLYIRYNVYGHQMYPLAMSDMRLIDNKISTTWCQRQAVKVNTTFNAFVLNENPKISSNIESLSMVRHLVLEDDTKEYWGFYLIKGSSVTVSTCARWPGASLIVIRGHKHLHECAYIGDNSSEELDEIMESLKEGNYNNNETYSKESPVNAPKLMKRHREGVQFHHPIHANISESHKINHTIIDTSSSEISDPIIMKFLLNELKEKNNKINKKHDAFIKAHSKITQTETKNIQIQPPSIINNQTNSEEAFGDIIKKLTELGPSGLNVLNKVNEKFGVNLGKTFDDNNSTKPSSNITKNTRPYKKPHFHFDENIEADKRKKREIILEKNLIGEDEENDLGIEEGFTPKSDGIADHRGTINETDPNDHSNSEFWSSFSSSEEALLNCDGLILNLPLTPHHKCNEDLSEIEADETYLANTITYRIPLNGYYFFVFNSENEIQPNYIRVQFHLNKVKYDVSNSVKNCTNTSLTCSLDLSFFSSEKVVMELPYRNNDSLWDEEFIVISECEPRTVLYLICVIAVPVLVILFAFT